MVRTQIQLTEAQARRLRIAARREGISLAEAIRRLVDRGLADGKDARTRLYARAAEAVGRYRDRRGAKDVASGHDAYLDEAFAFDRHFDEAGFTAPGRRRRRAPPGAEPSGAEPRSSRSPC